MKHDKLLIWILIIMGFSIFVNFYLCCYNLHNLNQHIEKHEVVREITTPTVIQIDMNYKQSMDTTTIKVENQQ